MEKKNVLVTGGAGFIGSFLCEALLKAGNRVICIDNFSTGNVRNIEPLLRNPDFQFLRLDVSVPFDLESFSELDTYKVKFVGIQEIYHLAVPTAVKGYEQYRMQALLANAIGTRHVLDIAAKYRSKAVLVSAGSVYGNIPNHEGAIEETALGVLDHLNARACFNEGKRFAETMFATYADVHNLDLKIARVFRVYGPRMPLFQGHQIPDFILNVLDGKPLAMSGDEQSATSLLYVADAVDGLIRLMRAESGIGPVNLGSDASLKIVDVAKKIMELAGHEVPITFEPAAPFLVPLGLPALKKAKERLGWLPLVRLDDGLRKTIDDVRANKLLLTGS